MLELGTNIKHNSGSLYTISCVNLRYISYFHFKMTWLPVMIPGVSSCKIYGKDLYNYVIFLVKSGLEVWSRIHWRDRT